MRMIGIPLVTLAVGLSACGDRYGGPDPGSLTLELETVVSGLASPVYVTSPPGDDRLFVVEQAGVIRIVENGQLRATPFLDITSLVRCCGEQGLLSLAFHPQYASKGEFYVYYTEASEGDTRVVRYRVSSNDPNAADAGSAELVLAADQPASNHNGGLLKFGPDGYLYVGLGDGGGGGDTYGNGQNLGTLLGAILRIDVDVDTTYAVPADNPFVGQAGARGEIWAYGLRNPWRFSFDRATGDLYIGDVGQNAWEEIDVEPAGSGGGRNYGWNIMEGAHCYYPPDCDPTGLVLPVHEYANSPSNCSVIGGYVYRGSRIPALRGHYLYSDFCSGFVRSFRHSNGQATDPRDWSSQLPTGGNVSSFGEEASGELYITTLHGQVYRIAPKG